MRNTIFATKFCELASYERDFRCFSSFINSTIEFFNRLGRFLYAAQTHLSQDTEIRTALRASVLAHYVLSLARASDNSCELFELENALNPGSASGCTKSAGRAARPAHTCLDLNPGSPDCTL